VTTIYRSPAGQRAVEMRYRDYLQQWPTPSQTQTVSTRHGETFVIACGPLDAPPVVALHGAGTNSTIWLGEAAGWATTRRVYLVDVIGEPGLSAPARPALQSNAYAEWLDDVLDDLGVSRAAFVGASLGGWLALDYAIRRQHRVERLVLRAPGGIGRQKYGAVLAAIVFNLFGASGRRRAVHHALAPAPDLGDFLDYMALIQRSYRPRRDKLPVFTDDQLRALAMPLLATLGECDRMLDSADTAARLRRLTPHATIAVMPDTGHAVLNDSDIIDRFLTETTGR
jgi:pimeloyl-ACP methyl ester carboxylesterase